MKKQLLTLIALIVVLAGCEGSKVMGLETKPKSEMITENDIQLNIGDEFVFGYSDEYLSHFTVSIKNKNGIIANELFKANPKEVYRQIFIPYHDLYYSKNFTKVIVINPHRSDKTE